MDVVINKVYRHYKGHLYTVIGVARNTETMEEEVIYLRYDDKNDLNIWCRPIKMWDEVVDDKGTKRFELVEDLI